MSYLGELRKIVGNRPLLSAGATIIVMEENKILLNLRSDTNTWGIPGGAIELGETLEETARRELAEETNLVAESFTLLTVLSGEDFYFEYPNGDKLYSVVALFRANGVSGDPNITDGESFELQYFDMDALPKLESRAEAIIRWISQ
jgi:8-oxo-dGTP pyrophosphatase MutT (NUDIX family)